MKELWKKLLKLAKIKAVTVKNVDGYYMYFAKYNAPDDMGLTTAPLNFMKRLPSGHYMTVGQVITADKLKPEQLVDLCIKGKCGMFFNKKTWEDEYGLHGSKGVVVVPQVESIEELGILIDMHEVSQ